MARRNDHSRAEIREMALKAAEDRVDRNGIDGLSTRKIAADIGYTVGSLYLVFQNLDDLIIQMNHRSLSQLANWLDQATGRATGPLQAVLEAGRAYLRFAARHPGRWALIFDHRLTPGTVLPPTYRDQVRSLFERVEKLLAELNPDLPPDAIALAARAIWGGVHGVCTLALDEKLDWTGIADAEKLTDHLITHYLSGWGRHH